MYKSDDSERNAMDGLVAPAKTHICGQPYKGRGYQGQFSIKLADYAGMENAVVTLVDPALQGTADVYPVLETCIDQTFGSIFDPSEYLWIKGHKVAGPVFAGQIKVEELFDGGESRGMFYMLTAYAFQVMLFSLGHVDINVVRATAASALTVVMQNAVCDRQEGIAISGRMMYDGRLPTGVVGVSHTLMQECLPELAAWLGVETTLDNVSGLTMTLFRAPATDLDCTPTVRMVVVDSPERGLWMNDVLAKGVSGDFDGDPSKLTFAQGYTVQDALRDLGSLDRLGLRPDPASFGTLTWGVQDAKSHKLQKGIDLAVGLAVKSFYQGLMTNYIGNVASAAVVLMGTDRKFLLKCAMRFNLVGFDASKPGHVPNLVSKIMDAIKINETVLTEVIMDFRKYVLGDAEQFSHELFEMLVASQTATSTLPATCGSIQKGGKTFNVDICNDVLSRIPGMTPGGFLSEFPLQNMVVKGAVTLGSSKRAVAMRINLAKTVASLRMSKTLAALSGRMVETKLSLPVSRRLKTYVAPRMSSDRPTFGGDAWAYIAEMVGLLEHGSKQGWNQTKKGTDFILGAGKVIQFGWKLEVVTPGVDGTTSYVIVRTNGGHRYARMIVRSRCRNIDEVDETPSVLAYQSGVEMVSLLDIIAEMIADLREAVRMDALSITPKSTLEWEREIEARKGALLNTFTRLPGQSNKGDEIVHGRIEVQSQQVSLDLPKLRDGKEQYLTAVAMATMIDGSAFADPFGGPAVIPFVGATSKSAPLTVAFVRKSTDVFPAHIYAVNQFIGNTDRIFRESGTPLQADLLLNANVIIDNGRDIGELGKRRFDGVVVMVSGAHLMTNPVYNGDQGNITPRGAANYELAPMLEVRKGLSMADMDVWAKELYGDQAVAVDLELPGWTIDAVDTPVPGRSGTGGRLSTRTYDVTTPYAAPTKSIIKGWFSGGHKTLLIQTRKNYYVLVDGEQVWIDSMVPQETMVGFQGEKGWESGKKQDLTVLAGRLAFAGKHDWTNQEVLDRDALLAELDVVLTHNNEPATGALDLYDEDGNIVGECIPMLLPTYVCHEPDIAKVKRNGFKRSLSVTRMLKESVTLPMMTQRIIMALADTATGHRYVPTSD